MSPKVFAATVEGYSNRLYRESSDRRRAAFLLLLPHTKNLSYEKFCKDYWPLYLDSFNKQEKEKEKGMQIKLPHEEFESIMQATRKRVGEIKRKKKEQEDKKVQDQRNIFKQRFGSNQARNSNGIRNALPRNSQTIKT